MMAVIFFIMHTCNEVCNFFLRLCRVLGTGENPDKLSAL